MPRPQQTQLATPPTQQSAATKVRRSAVKWDHRKDKYMLLAIFAQTNMRYPDFKQLSDMLGSEQYSAETLKKRFRDLEQMATEVMEDRQERIVEPAGVENGSDDDVTLVNEPLPAQITPPGSNNSTPCRRPKQNLSQGEQLEVPSPKNGPAARRRKKRTNRRGPPCLSPGNQPDIRVSGGGPTRIPGLEAIPPSGPRRGGESPQMSGGRMGAGPQRPAQTWPQDTWRDNRDNRLTRGPTRGSNRPGFSGTSTSVHYHANPHVTTVSVNNPPIHQYFEN